MGVQNDWRTRDPRGVGLARNRRPHPRAVEWPRDFPPLPCSALSSQGRSRKPVEDRRGLGHRATTSSCQRTEDKPPSGDLLRGASWPALSRS